MNYMLPTSKTGNDVNPGSIGEILKAESLVTEKDIEQALSIKSEIGGLTGQILLRIGAVTEENLLLALKRQLDMPILSKHDIPEGENAFIKAQKTLDLSRSWLSARHAAVWCNDGDESADDVLNFNVISSDPLSAILQEGLQNARLRAGRKLTFSYFLAENQTVETALARTSLIGDEDDPSSTDVGRLRELAEQAPIIDLVNDIFTVAISSAASDIHIEAGDPVSVVRLRIDGVLQEDRTFPRAKFDPVVSRIKLLAGMDIAERRLPQDGRSTTRFAGSEIDLRVSSLPSTKGESLVIRLLRKQDSLPDFKELGLTGRTYSHLHRQLKMPNGVFLVTGPTGSGKSTTLYRCLEVTNDGTKKILTIEDPVEYDVEGVTQIQVKADIGYTFASGLRAILRQDPDVILVGEIRDAETATIAIQAALTGHIVLSTLHTNSAIAAVTRLRDIGIAPYLIATSLRGLMAQRLVRKLCDHCKRPATKDEAVEFDKVVDNARQGNPRVSQSDDANWHVSDGCEKCNHTGYKGRIAIAEIIEIDQALRDGIAGEVSVDKLSSLAREQGFYTLYEDGLVKARKGLTSVSEIQRICSGDDI